jgi:hypothetical protein
MIVQNSMSNSVLFNVVNVRCVGMKERYNFKYVVCASVE